MEIRKIQNKPTIIFENGLEVEENDEVEIETKNNSLIYGTVVNFNEKLIEVDGGESFEETINLVIKEIRGIKVIG